MRHVILDTDLGSDVDDALALATLLGSTHEAALDSVTTVYGDTVLRARLARRYAALAGHELIAHPGLGATLSGREVWWAGHEGSLHAGLDAEPVADRDGVAELVARVLAAPGEIDVVAIGPLTNVAAAIEADPGFAPAVRHLWIMGGLFDRAVSSEQGDGTEHNIRSDVAAARIVFGAGIPATVTGLEVTQRLRMRADQVGAIAASGPLGAALDADIRQWWAFWDEEWNVPHDPVTVLTMLMPDLFTASAAGTVAVSDAGVTTHMPGPGATRVVTDLDVDAVAAEITRRVLDAQR